MNEINHHFYLDTFIITLATSGEVKTGVENTDRLPLIYTAVLEGMFSFFQSFTNGL